MALCKRHVWLRLIFGGLHGRGRPLLIVDLEHGHEVVFFLVELTVDGT
jgi:hypothetical protein